MKRGKNRTLFRMIMGRVCVMLGVIIALTALMLVAVYVVGTSENMWSRVDRFIAQGEKDLKAGNYRALASSPILKKHDAFDVVDASGHILYSSSGRTKKYGKVYLSYIPDYDKDVNYTLLRIRNKGYLLLYGSQGVIKEVTVLDQKRNVQYTTAGRSASKLSKKTVKLLSDNADTLFQKYAFTTAKGEKRYLLLHLDGSALYDQTQRNIQQTAILIGYVLGIILIVSIGGYTLTKSVTKPIRQLEAGMTQFSTGSRTPIDEIQEPTEVASAVRTFNTMNARIVEAEEDNQKLVAQKRRMTADLSHDLKTPVTVIQGYLNAMQDHLIPEEAYPKYLKIMSDKAQLLGDLINQISTYNKLDHPNVKLHFEPADMSEFVRSYFAGIYSEMEAAGHEIFADIPEAQLVVDLDRAQMNRVLDNLVNNSLKHTPSGTHFFAQLRQEGTDAVLVVGDDGPGLSEALAPHIFEPFIMGDASRTTGSGSGLGLAIAHSIVEKHHGTIALAGADVVRQVQDTFAVTIDSGTFFVIRLPLRQKS